MGLKSVAILLSFAALTLHPSNCDLFSNFCFNTSTGSDFLFLSSNFWRNYTGSYHCNFCLKSALFTALTLDLTRDILPARSRRAIRATIRPERRLGYTFLISYRLLTPSIPDLEIKRKKEEGEEDSKTEEPVNENGSEEGTLVPVSGESHVLCEVTAVGVYPTLQITDARCYGSAAGISKARLWSLFSLDK